MRCEYCGEHECLDCSPATTRDQLPFIALFSGVATVLFLMCAVRPDLPTILFRCLLAAALVSGFISALTLYLVWDLKHNKGDDDGY